MGTRNYGCDRARAVSKRDGPYLQSMNPALSKAIESTIARAGNEVALVAAAKSGDFTAFQELTGRYRRKIFRLALTITQRWEDAADVMQEAFLKSFDHLGEFEGRSRFYTWPVRITVSEGLMKLRKQRSDKTVPLADLADNEGKAKPLEFTDSKPDPDQLLTRSELQAFLHAGLRRLPANTRRVLVLRELEEHSTEETAEFLEVKNGHGEVTSFPHAVVPAREFEQSYPTDDPN